MLFYHQTCSNTSTGNSEIKVDATSDMTVYNMNADGGLTAKGFYGHKPCVSALIITKPVGVLLFPAMDTEPLQLQTILGLARIIWLILSQVQLLTQSAPTLLLSLHLTQAPLLHGTLRAATYVLL